MIDLYLGNCLDVLRTLEDDSIASCGTDPPYGIIFMDLDWDKDIPAERIWREVLRVLKPGAHLLSFGHPRTYHRLARAVEEAGFEIRDCLMWIYGQGIPKGLNLAIQFENRLCEKRIIDGLARWFYTSDGEPRCDEPPFRSPEANQWWDWNVTLKPAVEPIVLARKPLSESSVTRNIERWGTGALNIGASRIPTAGRPLRVADGVTVHSSVYGSSRSRGVKAEEAITTRGRHPPNVLLDEEAGNALDAQSGHRKSGLLRAGTPRQGNCTVYSPDAQPVKRTTFGDAGGASRFFYCSKAGQAERDQGLDSLETRSTRKWRDNEGMKLTGSGNPRREMGRNTHPAVKPVDLICYLVQLITPPGETVLDPFMGTGTTGIACLRRGFRFIGVEIDPDYYDMAERRIRHEAPLFPINCMGANNETITPNG